MGFFFFLLKHVTFGHRHISQQEEKVTFLSAALKEKDEIGASIDASAIIHWVYDGWCILISSSSLQY